MSKKTATILTQDELPTGAITPHVSPLYLSSTFIYPSVEEAQQVFEGKKKAFIYARWSHPNAEIVEQKMEALQTTKKTKVLAFNSGMAAISAVFQSLVKPKDVLIVQGNIYGTTVDYVNELAKQMDLQVYFVDFKKTDEIVRICSSHKKIKLFYTESPSNPTIECYDIKKIAGIAHQYGAKLAVDNTFATPLLQQPIALGADFEINSSTKYLNGHGTGVSGIVIGADAAFMEKQLWKIRKLHGTIIAPFDAWMLNLGMKTLNLRMKAHCENAMKVATFLSQHKAVKKVNYLGLKSHPDHALAKKQMSDFGGVLSFELKNGYKAGLKLMKKVKVCKLTASLGTTDTLIQHPASMSHYFVPKAQREKFGITDGLIRLSVGLEDVEDIISDLEKGL
jgi:methionine-gamma-lyase